VSVSCFVAGRGSGGVEEKGRDHDEEEVADKEDPHHRAGGVDLVVAVVELELG